MSVNTLLWRADGGRKFTCVHQFDHIYSSLTGASIDACAPSRRSCSVNSMTFKRILTPRMLNRYLQFELLCNTTKVEMSYLLNTNAADNYVRRMLTMYSCSRIDVFECFSLIRRRRVDVSALIEPFKATVWALMFVTIFVFVRVCSWLKLDTFCGSLTRISLNFISAIGIKAYFRRNSHLSIIGCALVFCFFVSHIHNNFIMFLFLS